MNCCDRSVVKYDIIMVMSSFVLFTLALLNIILVFGMKWWHNVALVDGTRYDVPDVLDWIQIW